MNRRSLLKLIGAAGTLVPALARAREELTEKSLESALVAAADRGERLSIKPTHYMCRSMDGAEFRAILEPALRDAFNKIWDNIELTNTPIMKI